MTARLSVRWRLVAWVSGVLLIVCAMTFGVVYERTSTKLRAQVDEDVRGDAAQLAQSVRALRSSDPRVVLDSMTAYARAQPFRGTTALLFAAILGYGTASNHPELVGAAPADHGESAAEQARENALGRALLRGPLGVSTRRVADVGAARFDERILTVGRIHVRIGAGEPLAVVVRAEHSIARSFLIAGSIALALALLASYLAAASISRPLRRMARVAAVVDDGDLTPRMAPAVSAGSEIRVLAESFNHMLDRLAAAFAAQREFIADASHELRTPLTVIAGQLEVLAAEQDPAPADVQRVQRLVAAEIARTSRLVDDMLLLARSERGDFVRPDALAVSPFIQELWVGIIAGQQRRFELGPVPDVVLRADPDRLAQALRNLIRNAIDHTTAPDGLVRLDIETRGERMRFIVRDDGPGIEPEQLRRVFERFHRTDASRIRAAGGAGLGLAIVQAIAEAHGGSARAVSQSRGARLDLELPGIVSEQSDASSLAAARTPATASDRR